MNLKVNLAAIMAHIPAQVTLVAVAKTQPPEMLQAALDAGLRVFGENRVQEAQAHWTDMRAKYDDLRLHLIGPLQTNKVRDAVRLFDVIETIDRSRLVDALAAEMTAQGRALDCMIQVNIGREPQKAGVAPEALTALYEHCRASGLHITGLMCIPPASDDPVPYFAETAVLAHGLGLQQLSMGMSGDYVAAIAAGATHVRIGSLLFGARAATSG